MELNSVLEKLIKSNEYIGAVKESRKFYFSYALITIENSILTPWQLGFYCKSADKMTTFIIDKGKITVQKDEEIFKKPDMRVNPIDMEKTLIPFKKVMKAAENLKKEKYPKETIRKTIAILQNLQEYGTIWNVTFVTDSFKTINLKLSAENGRVLGHNMESIMNFVKN